MPTLYKVTLLIQINDNPAKWICDSVADQLEDGEELLKFMSVETTLEAELNPQELCMLTILLILSLLGNAVLIRTIQLLIVPDEQGLEFCHRNRRYLQRMLGIEVTQNN